MIKSLLIHFSGMEPLYINFETPEIGKCQPAEEDIQFDVTFCPFRQGPSIMHECGILKIMSTVVTFFNNIESIKRGTIHLFKEPDQELSLHADAQTIFTNTIFALFTFYRCNILTSFSCYAKYYNLSNDPKDIFYRLLSSSATESVLQGDVCQQELLKNLKKKIELFQTSFNNFFKTLLQVTTKDSARNSLVQLHNIMQLIAIHFDAFIDELRQESLPPINDTEQER